jgi:hypothetical protein
MKKSELVNRIERGIDMMFNSVGDNTPIGSMFSSTQNRELAEFTKEDFLDFLNQPYLNSHLGIFDGFYSKGGEHIDLSLFKDECSKNLLDYFNNNNFKKGKSFDEVFPYKSLSKQPQYFLELAEIIVNTLDKYGKPPLFHKRVDEILRYDWEKESE